MDEKNASLSYEGLTEAEVIRALYHGTRAMGFGAMHDTPGFTVEDAEAWVQAAREHAHSERAHILHFDYVSGRPLKVTLNTDAKVVERVRLYDRDAGEGQCAAMLERARARKAA
jgi:hypothetical protein